MRRFFKSGVVLALTVVAVAACGSPASTTTTSTTTSSSSTTSTTLAPETQTVLVAFAFGDGSDCSEVKLYERIIDAAGDPIRAAFDQLVTGPNRAEQGDGAGSFFSLDTSGIVLSTDMADGLLVVDLVDARTRLANASTSCGSESLLAQLNATAFQFDEVERVTYEFEGSCDEFFNWLQRDCVVYSSP